MVRLLRSRSLIILLAIVALAVFLRVFRTADLPLYGDELTIVEDSYSLLQLGTDSIGKKFPITFTMGAGRPAGYVYGSIPFVAVFGPTAYGARGLSILSGLGIIVLIFFLARKIFSAEVGLIAALLTALSPWELSLSRGGFEAHLALFLALAGFLAFLYGQKKPWLFMVSAALWGLTIHTYPTYKLVLPIFVTLVIWFTGGFKRLFNEKSKKYVVGAIIIGAVFGLVALRETFLGTSEQRFFDINIFSQRELKETIVQKINLERTISESGTFGSVFHNKPVEYFTQLRNAYLSNLSMDFLFLKGDGNPRHNMGQMGQLYLAELITIFAGIVFLVETKKKRILGFLISWVSIAPLASAFVSGPHTLRSAFMLPPLVVLSALGVTKLFERGGRWGKLLLFFAGGIWLVQFLFLIEKVYFLSPNKYSRYWSYPARKASELAMENRKSYSFVVLSDRIPDIEFAYPVYAKTNPQEVVKQNNSREKLSTREFKRFENVYIGNVSYGSDAKEFLDNIKGTFLLIDYYENGLKDVGKAEVVSAPDSYPILLLIKR